ncbi:MAG: hypothetical protein NTY38_24595, partial [Acidobacteria bacterium]|nr:hypothetical protein [Acidobacteriota bacterium]
SNLRIMFEWTPEQEKKVQDYTIRLEANLVSVIGSALSKMQPATLAYGQGTAGFAINRRQTKLNAVTIGVNPQGPTDHSVPVVEVKDAGGKVMAVLFGYACHNTTLTAEHYRISGDYAGYAQSFVEQGHPGAVALFLELCGGDQNPNPRSKLELAEKHGRELADSVERVLGGKLKPVAAKVKVALRQTELTFAKRTREDYEKELESKIPSARRRAALMLKT